MLFDHTYILFCEILLKPFILFSVACCHGFVGVPYVLWNEILWKIMWTTDIFSQSVANRIIFSTASGAQHWVVDDLFHHVHVGKQLFSCFKAAEDLYQIHAFRLVSYLQQFCECQH